MRSPWASSSPTCGRAATSSWAPPWWPCCWAATTPGARAPSTRWTPCSRWRTRRAARAAPGMEALSSLLDQPTVAQAEIEILKSNLVLGRTVEAQALDIVAQPTFNPLVGDALVRRRLDAPSLRIERFEVPAPLRGTASASLPGRTAPSAGRILTARCWPRAMKARNSRPPGRASPWSSRCATWWPRRANASASPASPSSRPSRTCARACRWPRRASRPTSWA